MQAHLDEAAAKPDSDDDGLECLACGNSDRATIMSVRLMAPGSAYRSAIHCTKCGTNWHRHIIRG
ncbi:hypothetical protein [Thalassospira marina]|uniref:TFIIS-type domain-containing protein n=1 Tax=Thalassospira marina TaxID=2048283 RepID=A0A2N3KJR3_9PROT|nr:hypothetical protein [Thalassospira marina]PKR50781.1 hypothetical protein COO20_20300 [Thalassospira marina]